MNRRLRAVLILRNTDLGRNHIVVHTFLALALFSWVGGGLHAQDEESTSEKRREEEKRRELDQAFESRLMEKERTRDMDERDLLADRPTLEKLVGNELDLEYGGMLNSTFLRFRSGGSNRLYESNLHLWVDLRWKGIHEIYAREWWSYVHNDSGLFDDRDSNTGPRTDQLWYRLVLDRAIEKAIGAETPFTLDLSVGRIHQYLGAGLTYNRVHEGIHLEGTWKNLDAKFFASRNLPHQSDIDSSRPSPDKTDRRYYGGEVGWSFPVIRPYGFFLIQKDRNSPFLDEQKWHYDSEYYGGGILLTDLPVVPRFRLELEYVHQLGSATGDGSLESDPIDAHAIISRISYEFPTEYGSPTFTFSYLLGSGDSDRLSVSNAVAGNQAGTTDRSFLYFGFVSTGFSYAPTLSNIHVLSAEWSWWPFAAFDIEDRWGSLSVGISVYGYWKDRVEGGISGVSSNLIRRYIGHEFDFFLEWDVSSDLSLFFEYGIFFADEAFDVDGESAFLSTGVTLKF